MSHLRELINLCEDKKIILEAKGCQKCGSDKILRFSAKCSDLCWAKYKGQEHIGYVPSGIGIDQNDGYGDYVQGDLCVNCGQMQGRFPVSERNLVKTFGKAVATPKAKIEAPKNKIASTDFEGPEAYK